MNYFNFSETSSEPFYKSKINSQKGGFLGDIFGNNYSSLLFNAVKENNMSALNFLINQKEVSRINYQDENGLTILHMLINKYDNPDVKNTVDNILKRNDIKDIINIQDNNGNTPLHMGVISGNYKLCDELIYAGANPLIKNNAGLYVESETETVSQNKLEVKEITAKEQKVTDKVTSTPVDNNSVFISKKTLETKSDTKDSNIIQKIVNSVTSTLQGSSDSESDKEERNPNAYSNLLNTSEFINDLANNDNKELVKNQPSLPQGKTSENLGDIVNTSEFLDKFIKDNKINTKESQSGGKKIKKTRKLNTNTDLTENSLELPKTNVSEPSSSSMDLDMESSSVDEMSELSRMINNQATEIHERTVKKIAELLGMTEQESRVIKAYIYNEVKNQHPELNNFDRAVEMEKRITKDYLESLDKKKLKELSDMISEKQKNKPEKTSSVSDSEEPKPKKATKAKKEKEAEEKPKKKSKKLTATSSISDTSLTSLS
jgi:ankyrin repeat protein